MKNVLIISASLRQRSNSERLAAAFAAGAREAGHTVEEIQAAVEPVLLVSPDLKEMEED